MHAVHLTRRFFGSVFARSLAPDELDWVASTLTPAEFEVWRRQPRYDLRHSFGVARRVEQALDSEAGSQWLAAALVHDVGKVEARLGIAGRVLATIFMIVRGRAAVRAWRDRPGWRGRFGRYADHGPIGAAMLRAAGARAVPARWAEVHHQANADHLGTGLDLPEAVVLVLRDSDRD